MRNLIFTLIIFITYGCSEPLTFKEFKLYNKKFLGMTINDDEHFIFMLNVSCISCSKEILRCIDIKGSKKLDIILIGNILDENEEYFNNLKRNNNLFFDSNSNIIKYDVMNSKGLFLHIKNSRAIKITHLNFYDHELMKYLENNNFQKIIP